MKKNGLIIVNKEAGMTSQHVVNRVKRLFSLDKAGHTGTLDPMATGVLPVLCNRAVKASEYLTCSDKHYIAVLRLGIATDTEDVTGNVVAESSLVPTETEVRAVVSHFVGEIMQVPPMVSALKRNGQKLVDLARRGITVEREARPVTVYSIDVSVIDEKNYLLDVRCSKGTYIRTLCADIGKELGCFGTMASLCRAESAGFSLTEAHTLEELEKMSDEEKEAVFVPTEKLFSEWEAVELPPFFARLAKNGCEIYLRKIGVKAEIGTRFRLYDGGNFFAVGEVEVYDDGDAIRVLKLF